MQPMRVLLDEPFASIAGHVGAAEGTQSAGVMPHRAGPHQPKVSAPIRSLSARTPRKAGGTVTERSAAPLLEGRQFLPEPPRVGRGFVPRDAHHRVIALPLGIPAVCPR